MTLTSEDIAQREKLSGVALCCCGHGGQTPHMLADDGCARVPIEAPHPSEEEHMKVNRQYSRHGNGQWSKPGGENKQWYEEVDW